MSLFNAREWDNFRRVTLRSPWRWPGYAVSLAYLVSRRVFNSIQLRRRKAPHLGLKKRPEWLPGAPLAGMQKNEAPLVWPAYASMTTDESGLSLPRSALAEDGDDPEAVLARHRWGDCLFATLTGGGRERGALDQVSAWLAAPPERAHAAWETYSCCERVVNLAVLLASHPECRGIIDDATLRRFFGESLEWIDSRLEYYGLARTNNHLLNNARAMVVAGTLLSYPSAVASGLLIFARMSRELFGSSGFLRERSSHYQLVVANWLFDVLHFARAAAPLEESALRAMQELEMLGERVAVDTARLVQWMGDAGTHIGDISPDAHPQWTLQRLRLLYPERLQDTGSASLSHDSWLLAERGRSRLAACSVPASFPYGYADHGHHDLGGFIWIHDGCLVLADAGRSTYNRRDTARFQCGASAHNTLAINGLGALPESLLNAGQWLPKPYADANVEMQVDGEVLMLSHDGFSRIPGIGRHRRSVRFVAGGLHVEDQIDGDAEVQLEMYWHFPPGFTPSGGAGVSGAGMRINVALVIGSASSDLAWGDYPYATAYGEQVSATMLTVRGRVRLPCSLSTVFKVTPCAA